MITCCDAREKIVEVDCRFDNGRFHLRLPYGCVSELFTARFIAPADFTAGDTLVVKDLELPVMTSQMEAAGTGAFKTGAVMLCEIDLDRKLAFICTGGTSSGEDVDFQTSDLVYYIDPLGDDSPNNTGPIDSPFKTLAGAGRAAWENIVMNPLGRLVFSFNPGTYELTSADLRFMTQATHPLGLTFRGTTSVKPLIIADYFASNGGVRHFENIALQASGPTHYTVCARYGANVSLKDTEIIAGRPECNLIACVACGAISVQGATFNGNGYSLVSCLQVHGGFLSIFKSTITLEALPRVTMFAECIGGHIFLPEVNFSGSTSGMRYSVYHNGVINTYNSGPNYLPGTIAGAATLGGLYT